MIVKRSKAGHRLKRGLGCFPSHRYHLGRCPGEKTKWSSPATFILKYGDKNKLLQTVTVYGVKLKKKGW